MVGRTSAVLVACAIVVLAGACSNRKIDPRDECNISADCLDPKAPHCFPSRGECVACLADDHCSCHHVCDQNECVALGAESPGFASNAHGNWVGTPGDPDYLYDGLCETNNECRIGEICNPLTGGCMAPPEPWETCQFNPCPAGLECEPATLRCLPPALCKSSRNCCNLAGFNCSSPDGEELGLCFARECEPPADLEGTCPYEPKLTESCPTGAFCSPLGMCVQCVCDDDCILPQRPKCDAIAGECVEPDFCREPDDCGSGQSCDRQHQVCKPLCEDTAGCNPWESCSPTDDVCHCTVDGYDPNGSRQEAANVPLPAIGEQLLIEAILCDNETDWFAFTLNRADHIDILGTTESFLEADMVFMNEDEVRLAAAPVYDGYSGSIEYTADLDGVYYLRIEPVAGEGDFSLEVALSQGEVCDEGGSNDSVVSAIPINDASLGPAEGCTVTSGSLGSSHEVSCVDTLRTCANDIDFYLVHSPAGSSVEVMVDNFPGEDIELVMYGPFDPSEPANDTRLLDSSTSSNSSETVTASNRPEVFYVIRITEYWGDASGYDLHLTVEPPGGAVCEEDEFDGLGAATIANTTDEPGLNDRAATASGVSLSPLVPVDLSLSLCFDDQDWFVLGDIVSDELRPLSRGQRIVAEVQDVSTTATDLLVFVGSDEAQVSAQVADLNPAVQSVQMPTNDDLIYVAVVANSTVEQPVEYTLHTVLETPPTCDLDSLGDLAPGSRNDTPADAIDLASPPWPATWDDSPFTFPHVAGDNLSSCVDDDDWYAIATPEYSAINVSITYDSSNGELGLAVYDSSVATQTTTPSQPPTLGRLGLSDEDGTSGQSVRADTGEDTAYILVYNRSGWPVLSYELTVELTPAGCIDDMYEDNDTSTEPTAVPLTLSPTVPGREEAQLTELWVCDSDQDWYAVPLQHQDEIEIVVNYDPAEGNTNMYLYAPGGTGTSLVSDTDTYDTGVLDLSYTVPPTAVEGDYLIKMDPYGSGGHENAYELSVTVTRSCLDDRYGPATFDLPAVLSLPTDTLAYGTMQLCDNEDWFEITAASSNVSVCARFDHEVADLDVEVYDTYGMPGSVAPVSYSRTKENFEQVVFAGTGTHWARVYLDVRSSGDITYSLWVLPNGGGCPSMCADDVVNGDETDVDCGGGGACPTCRLGYACNVPSDCTSNNCTGGICQ